MVNPNPSTRWDERSSSLIRLAQIFFIPLGIILFFPVSLLFLFVIVSLWRSVQNTRQGGLLWAMAIGARTGRPLGEVVETYADGSKGRWRIQLYRLADCLKCGQSLPDALEECRSTLPPDVVTAIRVGWEAGDLGNALEHIAVQFTKDLDAAPHVVHRMFLYLGGMFLLLAGIVSFVMYYIIPKFKKIFLDFGTELPAVTKLVIFIGDMIASTPLTFVALALVAVMWVSVSLSSGLGLRSLLYRWPFVWLRRVFPRFESPEILRNFRIGIESERPLDAVLSIVLRCHPDFWVHKRLVRVEDSIKDGADCWISLYETGFLKRNEAAVLLSAQHAGNLPWALDVIAENIERRTEYRLRVLTDFVRPAVVFAFGLAVAFVGLAFFMPLIKLLNDLS